MSTTRTVGAILPADILDKIAKGTLPGGEPRTYHLLPNEKIGDATSREWARLLAAWSGFDEGRTQLHPTDLGTTHTRERWLLPLFNALGFGRLQLAKAREIDGKSYAISHAWNSLPIHLLSFRLGLDEGKKKAHSLLQEFLNRNNDHLWGIVTNGLTLRLLRNSVSLTRQAYVEFDLEAMMRGQVYSDFVLLWQILHQSRFEGERPELCQLEKWSQAARTEGIRFLDGLSKGVEQSIAAFGQGALANPANQALREALREGKLDKQDFYRELLRLVYRLLFVFVAEDRGLLLDPTADHAAQARYTQHYSTKRLRRLSRKPTASRHTDLYQALKLILDTLSSDGCPALALPALGSLLFSSRATPYLDKCEIANHHLVAGLNALAYSGRRAVDFKNLGAEELGSVYESLLELHPEIHLDPAGFKLESAQGNERKKTGSYYTPASLISCLLDSALNPVLDAAGRDADAILRLKVVDPACGSGHFLIAAAHRIAKRLASVRTGDDEPSPDAERHALREVIGRCIYGVDMNPMAVELCKVSLWMEAMEPGKPLSFLEHRILPGNSLLGTTPRLLAGGIPPDAFKPLRGDDPEVVRYYKRRNDDERLGQGSLFSKGEPLFDRLGSFALNLRALEELPSETIDQIREKEQRWHKALNSDDYFFSRFLADAWCAAFVYPKDSHDRYPITESDFRRIEKNPYDCPVWMTEEIKALTRSYNFFHWHLAFPDVFPLPKEYEPAENTGAGWNGGFDLVLGNPPWERIKLQEKEWFAHLRPDIAGAPNAAARGRMILNLATEDPPLFIAFETALRIAEGESALMRNTKHFPLCGRGDVNTFAVFAELAAQSVEGKGRAGIIIPSSIATGDTTKHFFEDLATTARIGSLHSFFEVRKFFYDTDDRNPFCLLTLSGVNAKCLAMDLVFDIRQIDELGDPHRHFTLSAEDIGLLNPSTRTCPIFRTQRDAEIVKTIYRRVPVLWNERTGQNAWGIKFMRMLDMSNDSGLFRTRVQLEAEGWQLTGNIFARAGDRYLPLYEAKMIHQFNHRFGDYSGIKSRPGQDDEPDCNHVPVQQLQDPDFTPLPRYWVPANEVKAKLNGNPNYLLGFRNNARSTDEHTFISTQIPLCAVGNSLPIMTCPRDKTILLGATVGNLVFDWLTRQSLGGPNLNFFIVKQIAAIEPDSFTENQARYIFERVLKLTYTDRSMAALAMEMGYDGPPFIWNEQLRFNWRCELDALYFHLYGLNRDDTAYILDSFPIVRDRDMKLHGHYRTKETILRLYDERAI